MLFLITQRTIDKGIVNIVNYSTTAKDSALINDNSNTDWSSDYHFCCDSCIKWWLSPIPFGSSLTLNSQILPHSNSFFLKLQKSCINYLKDDVGLSIRVDLNKSVVTLNSYLNGNWGHEEAQGIFPFSRDSNFLMTIQVTPSQFEILTDGVQRWTFKHRYPPENLVWLVAEGGVRVSNVNVMSTFNGVPKRVGLDIPSDGHNPRDSPQYGFAVASQGKPQVMNANIQYVSGPPNSYPPSNPSSFPPNYPTNPPGYPINPPAYPINPPAYPTNPPAYPTNPPAYPTNPPAYPANPPAYSVNPPRYPTNPPGYPANPPGYPSNHPPGGNLVGHNYDNNSHGKSGGSGLLNQAGQMIAGVMATRGVLGPILGGKKAMKAHKKQAKSENKLRKKALKYGLPVAGIALGAYALKKGHHKVRHFGRRSSSSSSSSSSSD